MHHQSSQHDSTRCTWCVRVHLLRNAFNNTYVHHSRRSYGTTTTTTTTPQLKAKYARYKTRTHISANI